MLELRKHSSVWDFTITPFDPDNASIYAESAHIFELSTCIIPESGPRITG